MTNPSTTTSETTSEHDIVVLGAGPAGVAAARRAAELGADVAIVGLRAPQGGGSVPGRVLRTAYADAASPGRGDTYGETLETRSRLRFEQLRARADRVGEQQTASVGATLRALGVTVVPGRATFESAHVISVADGLATRMLHAARVIVAVGAVPQRPDTVDFDGRTVVGPDDLLCLHQLPARLTIVGAGPIGLEYASLFAALGSRVTLAEQAPSIASFADAAVLHALLAHLDRRHVEILTSTRAVAVERDAYGTTSTLVDGQPPIASRAVIWAAGMQPATTGLDLAAAGVAVDPNGWIGVDSRFQTSQADIFAAGAAVDGWMLASESEVAGRAAASAALDCQVDDRGWPIARALHTIPEIASVGPTQDELERQGIPFVRGIATASDVLAAQINGDRDSILALFVSPGDRTLLAAHAFGSRSIETIHLAQMAIATDVTIDALADFPFNHPSSGEAYQVAARDAVGRLREPVAS
jgi:NAD(P) transhydrogenase